MNTSQNIRILHLFPSSLPGGSEISAFETIQCLFACENIKQFGIFPNKTDFVVTVSKYLELIDTFNIHEWLSPRSFSILEKLKWIKGFWSNSGRIARFIKHNHITHVITHSIVIPIGAFGAWCANCPHVWYLHEYGDMDHRFHFNYGKLFSLTLVNKLSRNIIVNSLKLKKYYTQYIPIEKLNLVYYAVSVKGCPAPTLTKEPESLRICMTGRIAHGKNQMVVVKALQLLQSRNIHPHIVFVGSQKPSYMEKLKEFIEKENLIEQVTFTGQQANTQQFVQEADCVLVCSIEEAFGRVTIEGMKAGKIVIVSNTGAGPEIVNDGNTGYLFPPTDATALADILQKLWNTTDIGDMTTKAQAAAFVMCNADKHRADILKAILN